MGKEDHEVIGHVIGEYQQAGKQVSGPKSGEIVFVRAATGEFDAAVAMYCDLGHIPVKLPGFRMDGSTGKLVKLNGVTITLGLPFIRTSVDHGAAFDIAGKGLASPQCLIDAIDFAFRLTGNQQMHSATHGKAAAE